MEADKETIDHIQNCKDDEEVIKTSIGFKKGVIAGILILILILCVGALIGYAVGTSFSASHYNALLLECQNRTLDIWNI